MACSSADLALEHEFFFSPVFCGNDGPIFDTLLITKKELLQLFIIPSGLSILGSDFSFGVGFTISGFVIGEKLQLLFLEIPPVGVEVPLVPPVVSVELKVLRMEVQIQ